MIHRQFQNLYVFLINDGSSTLFAGRRHCGGGDRLHLEEGGRIVSCHVWTSFWLDQGSLVLRPFRVKWRAIPKRETIAPILSYGAIFYYFNF